MTFNLRFCIVVAICTLTTALAQSPPSLLSSSEVGRLFGYPENRIQTRDLTEAAKRQLPQAIIATEYYSDDGTFAPIIISLAAEKSILTPSMLKDMETYFQKAQEQAFIPAVRKVDLGGGIQGIAGLGGFGPGATEERIIVKVPGRMDVLLKITIPGEGLNVDAETEGYHRLITEGGDSLTERLIECAEDIIAKVMQISPSSALQTPVRPIPPSASSVVSEDNSIPSVESSDSRPSPAVEAEPSKSTPWSWIIGAILFLAVVGGVLFKFLRK